MFKAIDSEVVRWAVWATLIVVADVVRTTATTSLPTTGGSGLTVGAPAKQSKAGRVPDSYQSYRASPELFSFDLEEASSLGAWSVPTLDQLSPGSSGLRPLVLRPMDPGTEATLSEYEFTYDEAGGTDVSALVEPRKGPSDGSSSSPWLGIDDVAAETIRNELRVGAPAMMRADLDFGADQHHRFHDMPGGIVLGREALPVGLLFGGAQDSSGLGLRWSATNGIELVQLDGTPLPLPAVSPERARACLAFTAEGTESQSLVSVTGFGRVQFAPQLGGGEVTALALRSDMAPHLHLPAALMLKSVIVDRSVHFGPSAGLFGSGPWGGGDAAGIAFGANLEVRFYSPDVLDGSRRVLTLGFTRQGGLGSPLVHDTPELTPDQRTALGEEALAALAADLEDLAEVAGWVGFFRWARANDVQGLDGLQTALDAAAGPVPAAPTRVHRRPVW